MRLGEARTRSRPERRQVQEVPTQQSQTSPTPTRFPHYVSGHRFGLMMLACAAVFAAKLAVVYTLVGLTPVVASGVAADVP